MSPIPTIILFILVLTPVTYLSNPMLNSGEGDYANQQKQHPIIDEIFEACGPLFFQSRSTGFSDEDQDCLQEVALRSQAAKNYNVIIDGHRDSSERKDISLTRAKKTRDDLVKHYNVNPTRLIVRDFGDTCPHELRDKALNGRVEFRYWREDRGIKSIPKSCAPGANPRFRIIR